MPKRNIFQKIKRINEITKVIRADTENLGVNVAFQVLPSERQINEFCRSARDLKRVAAHMKRLQKASMRLAAARELALAGRGASARKRTMGKKPIKYALNTEAMGLNAKMVTGVFSPKSIGELTLGDRFSRSLGRGRG